MRFVRRLIHALLIVLTLVVGASAAAIIVSQTAWFKDWLRGYIVREANQYLNGQLSIARLGGNLFFGVEMENVGISMDGSQVVAVKDLGLDYSVFELISKGLTADAVRLNQPVLYLRREGDTWSISRLMKRQEEEADRQGPAYPIAIDQIAVTDASVVVDDPVGTTGVEVPRRFDKVDAELSFKYEPVRYSIDITHVSFRGSDPEIGLNAMSGGVSVKDDTVYVDKLAMRTEESSISVDGAIQQYLTPHPRLNLRISSDKTSLPELARIVPALQGINLQPAYEIQASGPLDELSVSMNVRSSAGQLTGDVVADVLTPKQSVRGAVSVRHLNLAPIVKDAHQKSDITGQVKADVTADSFADRRSWRGRLTVDAPRIAASGYLAEQVHADVRLNGDKATVDGRLAAYGSRATVKGNVTLAAPVAYDLRGRAEHVDLRRLPPALKVPPGDTDVTVTYHAHGTEPGTSKGVRNVTADVEFDQSTVAGAHVAAGSTASVNLRGEELSYAVNADVADVDLQRLGKTFNVPALTADRFEGKIAGHVNASGSGTDPRAMNVTASGTLVDSRIFGGDIPQLAFNADVNGDSVHVKADGSFSGFDPAALTGKPAMKGSVAGTLNVDATLRDVSNGITPETVDASGTIDLTESTIGMLEIQHASLDGDYRDRGGEIRRLEVVGHDLNVLASGPVALGDTGDSHVTLHADTPSLQTLGELFDVPVSGIAKVDATITGNRTALEATGTVVGNDVSYGDNAALAVSADYTLRVPELDFQRAHVEATSQATFLTVAGQNINEVSAKTTYENKELTFEANAKQPERTLDATGALLLHPDHQEVHLERVGLVTRGQTWQLAPGSSATIKYGGDSITVEHAQLTSGDQTILADGAFGAPGDALKVTMQNVELANVDALLLRQPQFTGRLNASGVVTGTTKEPRAKAEFTVTGGGFRQFKYDSLTGTVDYTGPGITIDTRLQQNANQWLRAKGYVPSSAFAKAEATDEARDAGDHVAAASPEDAIDVTIDSSPIDLGLVQGFTTALTDVTGTVEAHVRVTGSAADPHPTGAITVANGAATVVPLGVKYQQIAGRVDLEPDRVHVDRLTVLDNHKSELTVTGDLAVHERELGAVQIRVVSNDFKVMDNELGNVRIKSDVAVTGELRAPHVEGSIAVTTGDVKLDEILAQTASSAYSTKPTEFLTAADNAPAPRAASPFDALTMNLRLRVPDDLVIKASSLQTPGSPVGLGALNVTLGGDVTATKQPNGPVRLVGAVNTIRGTYDFQGRRFEILRDGTIRFEGGDELNPRLDLRTRRIIQGVEARVNVTGTVREPSIQLSSTPPLEDADILSLIVFNQPINELGEGQQISLAARAQSIAAGAIVGQLTQSIGNLLELDIFEVNLAPETGGGPQVTIGQQIGKEVFLKVEQGIGDQSTTNVILEYQINDWLRLQSNVLQGASSQQSAFRRVQSTGADLIFFFSY